MSEATVKDMDVAEVIKIFHKLMHCKNPDDEECYKFRYCSACPHNYDVTKMVKAMSVAIPILEKSVKAD